MNIYTIIASLCTLAIIAGCIEQHKPRAPTAREQALVCWHQFETGRRASSADCPEL